MNAGKKILAVALDWGLGHATRMIPLLRREQASGAELLLAPTPAQAVLWSAAFPDATFIEGIPEYNITFPERGALQWHLIKDWPRLQRVIREEHQFVQRIAKQHSVQGIISDNRYGAYVDGLSNQLVTHQLQLSLPWWTRLPAQIVLHRLLLPFDQILVPDHDSGTTLSGALSHPTRDARVRYIGPLSRFENMSVAKDMHTHQPLVVLISGPEPHRSRFEARMHCLAKQLKTPTVIVGGQPGKNSETIDCQVTIYPHLPDDALAALLCQAHLIVCRSGYSTLMDLQALGQKALLVPTPGQVEQIYLAQHFAAQFGWSLIKEENLNAESLGAALLG